MERNQKINLITMLFIVIGDLGIFSTIWYVDTLKQVALVFLLMSLYNIVVWGVSDHIKSR